MLPADLYLPVILLLLASVAGIAAFATRRGEVSTTIGWMVITIVVLGVLAWEDWHAQASIETPATAYLILAVLAPVLTFAVALVLARKGANKRSVFLLSFGVAIGCAAAGLVSGLY